MSRVRPFGTPVPCAVAVEPPGRRFAGRQPGECFPIVQALWDRCGEHGLGRRGPLWCRRRTQIFCGASQGPTPDNKVDEQKRRDDLIIYGTAASLTLMGILALTFFREPIEDALYGGGLDFALGSVTLGDLAVALVWGVSLYFVSPLQILLLFLGEIDTERPSDWLLFQLGKAAGEDINNPQYIVPVSLQAAAIFFFGISGTVVAALFHAALGGATWGLSTGLGSCFAAGIYEVGRPRRLSREEFEKQEGQFAEFARIADERLQKNGQCHESEILSVLKVSNVKYRRQDYLSDKDFQRLMRRWAPKSERTTYGYYKNVSVKPFVDPFTGETKGSMTSTVERKNGE
eukprot:evm.model.scf_186.2 EVM.evm.TU.scf_186.2   scf_186:12967-16054(-)